MYLQSRYGDCFVALWLMVVGNDTYNVFKYYIYTIYIICIHTYTYIYIYSRSTLEACLIAQFCCKSPVLGTTECKDWLCLINYRLRYHYYCCFLCSVRYRHTTPISRQQKTFRNCAVKVPKNTSNFTHWRRFALPRIRRYFWF